MKEEIRVGVEFLRQFLSKYGNQLTPKIIDLFAAQLTAILHERYVNHWYGSMPMKGQAFRCLRIKRSENYIDPVLERILKNLNLTLNQLGLPNDFTLWIDPGEVSVRFGDQVGYTYTIAKLDQDIFADDKDENSHIESEEAMKNKFTEKVATVNKPCLIVENAEKILFDEKLTAFIRQNSSNDTDDLADAFDFTTIDEENKQEDLNIDEFIKLSAEKRTISPPCSSVLQRKNSSNIAIVLDKPDQISASNLSTCSSLENGNRLNTRNIGGNNVNKGNRLSFNDSCYYSSSSSSCASSFESNNDENNILSSWFNQNSPNNMNYMNNKTNKHKANVNYFNTIGNNTNSLYMDDNQMKNLSCQSQLIDLKEDQLPFSQGISFFKPLSKRENSFGFLNDTTNLNNLNSFNSINSGFLYANQCDNNNIYSETSSERSDTPNSCVTNSSSVSSSFPSFMNLNAIVPFPFDKGSLASNQATQRFSNPLGDNGSPTNSSTSSETSTTTISTGTEPIKSFNEDFDLIEIFKKNNNKPKSSKKHNQASGGQKQSLPFNNNDRSKQEPEQNGKVNELANQANDKGKSEDTYCGYVESFPYYYKLNRLYNALAVQKMQADRMKKSGYVSPMTIKGQQQGTPPNSFSPHGNQKVSGFNNNNNPMNQQQSRIGSRQQGNMTVSPSRFQMQSNTFMGNSPSKGNFPQQSSVLIPTNSPPNHSPGAISIDQQLINANKYFNAKSQLNSKMPYQNNKIGFPLSPSSAAQSFANHQNLNYNHNQQAFKQHHQPQQQQQQFQPYQIANMPTNNIHNGISPQQQISMDNSPINGNFQQFPSHTAENKNFAKQHQIMNAMYNQMNLRNTDMVKMSN